MDSVSQFSVTTCCERVVITGLRNHRNQLHLKFNMTYARILIGLQLIDFIQVFFSLNLWDFKAYR